MKATFSKTFAYYIIMIFVSFFLLSLGFTELNKGYFYTDKQNELLTQAKEISEIYVESHRNNKFDSFAFHKEMETYDRFVKDSFIITDRDLDIITASDDSMQYVNKDISRFYGYNTVLSGEPFWVQGNLEGLFPEKRYILCYPVSYESSIEAIAFVSIPLEELRVYINKVYVIIIFFLILSAILGFITIYWTSKEFVTPLRRLNMAANRISRGNFDERIEISDDMDTEMADLYKSFNLMAENLENLEKKRKDVVSDISHDLRSPITSIRGFVQAMLEGVIPPENYNHYLEIIYKETTRLNHLSESILQLNTLSSQPEKLNLSEFNINAVILEIIDLMKVKAVPKKIDLKTNFTNQVMLVCADENKVKRIIINLMDNAIKFTEKGSVTVSTYEKNNKVYISVKDTGIGLTEEEQERVFERFYKADASRGVDKSGSGLGLSIVYEFVKAHNQKITVESVKGKGTEFVFTLDEV